MERNSYIGKADTPHGDCSGKNTIWYKKAGEEDVYWGTCTVPGCDHREKRNKKELEVLKFEERVGPDREGKEPYPQSAFSVITEYIRGISPNTYKAFRMGTIKDWDGNLILNQPTFTEDGKLLRQKLKTKDKKMWSLWSKDIDNKSYFFGQYGTEQDRTKANQLVITEGELDAASVYEAFTEGGSKLWSPFCVSLPDGAGGLKVIEDQITWINSFEKVTLAFDNDEMGVKASEEVARMLGYDKVYVAKFSKYKDANDYLKANKATQLKHIINNAERKTIPTIGDYNDLLAVCQVKKVPVLPTGIRELDLLLSGGCASNEINGLVGGTSIGKTTLACNIVANLLKQGLRVHAVQTEMPMIDFIAQVLSSYLHKPLYKEMKTTRFDTTEAYQQWVNYNLSDNLHFMSNLTFSKEPKITPWEETFNGLRAGSLTPQNPIDFIFIDNLTGFDEPKKTRKETIDKIIMDINGLHQSAGNGSWVVSHLTDDKATMFKDGSRGKTFETGAQVSLNDLADSKHLKKYASNIVAVERDTTNISTPATIRLLKGRSTGRGDSLSVEFNPDKWMYGTESLEVDTDKWI